MKWMTGFLLTAIGIMAFSPLHADEVGRYLSIERKEKRSTPDLDFSTELYYLGSRIEVMLELKNTGDKPVSITKKDVKIRFLGADPDKPDSPITRTAPVWGEDPLKETFPVELKAGHSVKLQSLVPLMFCNRFSIDISILGKIEEKIECKVNNHVMLGSNLSNAEDIKTFIFHEMIQTRCRYAPTADKNEKIKIFIMRETDFDKIKDRLVNDRIILESDNSFIPVGGPHDPDDWKTSAPKGDKKWPENHDKIREIEQLKTAAALRIKNFKLPDNGALKVYVGEFRGILAASGSTYYFTKKNGKWQFDRCEISWLS